MIGAEREACSCLAQPHHPHEAEAMWQGWLPRPPLGARQPPVTAGTALAARPFLPPKPPLQALPVRVWSVLQWPAWLSPATVLPRKHSCAYSPPSSLKLSFKLLGKPPHNPLLVPDSPSTL